MFDIIFTHSALDEIGWFRKRERTIIFDVIEKQLTYEPNVKHEFILAEIDDFNRGIEFTRQNEQLMNLLDSRGQEKATISLAEARARLAAGPEPENGNST